MLKPVFCIASIICLHISLTNGEKSKAEVSDDIGAMMDQLLQNYDRHIRPAFGETPINVTMTAHILDLYDIDDQNHEFTVNMYLRHFWTDKRLAFIVTHGISELTMDSEHAAKIWSPDTFILNERRSKVHDLTLRNEFTKVTSDGMVSRSTRVSVTASCKMTLRWFPFDRHTCVLEFESYGNTAAEYVLLWKRNYEGNMQTAISLSEQISSTTFSVRATNMRETTLEYINKTYCRVAMEFFIARESTKYLQDFYFPAVILTIISFCTLHFGGSHEFRIQISTFCMITMIIFMSLGSSSMPKVSYQTALDFYIFNCAVMILNVILVHFGLYHYVKLQRSQGLPMRLHVQEPSSSTDGKETLCDDVQSDFIPIGRPAFSNKFKNAFFKCCSKSKTMLPIVFIIFNVIYWIVVLIGSSGYPDDFLILEAHN